MEYFFDKTATVMRSTYVGNKSTFAAVGTIKCNLQNLDEEMSKINDIQIGRGFIVYCGLTANVQETDVLVVGGVNYSVKGITNYDMGNIKFKKVLLVLEVRP